MALTTQDLKELAQRALDENNLEAANFLISSALKKSNKSPVKEKVDDFVTTKVLNQPETDLALYNYLARFQGLEVRFSEVAKYFESIYHGQLDQTWVQGENRPKWRQLISIGLSKFRNKGLLGKGKLKTSHSVPEDFVALFPDVNF